MQKCKNFWDDNMISDSVPIDSTRSVYEVLVSRHCHFVSVHAMHCGIQSTRILT